MPKFLIYAMSVLFVCLIIANYYIFNFTARGLEHAGQFGRCLSEKTNTKLDCGFDPVEHFKSPALSVGIAATMGWLNLLFLSLVLIFGSWFKLKSSNKNKVI